MQSAWAEDLGNVIVVHLGREFGSIDLGHLRSAEEIVARQTENKSPPNVVLDLHDVSYCGSEFLNLLVRCYRRVRARQGRFAVCGQRGLAGQVLEAAGVHELWESYENGAEAGRAMTTR